MPFLYIYESSKEIFFMNPKLKIFQKKFIEQFYKNLAKEFQKKSYFILFMPYFTLLFIEQDLQTFLNEVSPELFFLDVRNLQKKWQSLEKTL